jgi:hypothetical protein
MMDCWNSFNGVFLNTFKTSEAADTGSIGHGGIPPAWSSVQGMSS